MTRADISREVKNLVTGVMNESKIPIDGSFNFLAFVDDAMEQTIADLIPFMPEQLLTSENITLVAGQANYSLTTSFLWVWKVEKTITGEPPKEIKMINPLELQYSTDIDETSEEPDSCYFLGDVLYFVPTPASAYTNYAKVWLVRNEAAAMPSAGPTYLPAITHRLIVYKAAMMATAMLGGNPSIFGNFYQQRLRTVSRLWGARFQQRPRFVQESVDVRRAYDSRDLATYDWEW